jgi:hypothetical protein
VKAIGTIVVILVAAIAVTIYVVSRPPDRTLDAEGRAWVDGYSAWNAAKQSQLDRALTRMSVASETKNARLIEPLRGCFATFSRFGQAPDLLEDVERITLDACGRAERAVDVNDRFGTASLATINLHLDNAQDLLRTARRALDQALQTE